MPRDRHHAAVVQPVQRVDALNGAAFAVVEVPENNLVLVIKGLLLDGVIEDEAAISSSNWRTICLTQTHRSFDVYRFADNCRVILSWLTSLSSIADKLVDVANPLLQIR